MTLEQALLALKRIREAYRAWDAGRLEAEEALVEVEEALEGLFPDRGEDEEP
ncbi:hypothetical protein [Thermus scotoductus]|uniref:hypothetical protein n=1 Tax=Thermus scotoductus TaxID=37636 RepID=UPI0015623844|nr:hypothetical protein [Thermus scotoductus]